MIKEPTEYPYECLDGQKREVRVIGKSAMAPDTYVCEVKVGKTWWSYHSDLSELFDKPKVTSVWENVYPNCVGGIHFLSRERADSNACSNRIGVLRIDTIDGVSTPHLEKP